MTSITFEVNNESVYMPVTEYHTEKINNAVGPTDFGDPLNADNGLQTDDFYEKVIHSRGFIRGWAHTHFPQ